MNQHNEPDQVPAEACSWPASPSRLEPGPREVGAEIGGWMESGWKGGGEGDAGTEEEGKRRFAPFQLVLISSRSAEHSNR